MALDVRSRMPARAIGRRLLVSLVVAFWTPFVQGQCLDDEFAVAYDGVMAMRVSSVNKSTWSLGGFYTPGVGQFDGGLGRSGSTTSVNGALTVAQTTILGGPSTISGPLNVGSASATGTGNAGISGSLAVGSTLQVSGTTTTAALNSGSHAVSGTMTVSSTLGVSGATTLQGLSAQATSLSSLSVSGAASVGSGLTVTGTTTTGVLNSGNHAVTGAMSVSSTLGVSGATTLQGLNAQATTLASLSVTGGVSIGNGLSVSGTTTTGVLNSGSHAVSGAMSVSSTLGVSGFTTLAGASATSLAVSGTLSAGTLALSSVSISGAGSFGSVSAGSVNNLGFDFILGNGDQSSRGNSGSSRALVKAGGATLYVNYNSDFTGGTVINSATTVTGSLSVGGSTSLAGTTISSLSVSGTMSVASTFTVSGTTNTQALNSGSHYVSGALTVTGGATISNGLYVNSGTTTTGVLNSGTHSVSGTLSVSSTFSVSGTSYMQYVNSGTHAISGALSVTSGSTLSGSATVNGGFLSNGYSRVVGTFGVSNGGRVVQPNGYIQGGAVSFGDVNYNYGGYTSGWTGNTAGLMLECYDNTEIAVHDSGHRVISLMQYLGGGNNLINIGRNMAWGVSSTTLHGNVGIQTGGASGYPLDVRVPGVGGWDRVVATTSPYWGDGSTPYVTLGVGGASGIMLFQPHIVWSAGMGGAFVRLGRSHGYSGGWYWDAGTGTSHRYIIQANGGSVALQINTALNAIFTATIYIPYLAWNGGAQFRANCPAGWGYVNGFCYAYYAYSNSYFGAVNTCNGVGARLCDGGQYYNIYAYAGGSYICWYWHWVIGAPATTAGNYAPVFYGCGNINYSYAYVYYGYYYTCCNPRMYF